MHTDQQVYISGDDIWVDGFLSDKTVLSKIAYVRLLTRSGQVASEILVSINDGRFEGFLSIPSTLASDYYFIDCAFKGVDLKVWLKPVMVIHPQIPPVGPCSPQSLPVSFSDKSDASIQLETDKREYGNREEVTLRITSKTISDPFSIYVRRRDRLSQMADSVFSQFHPVLKHTSYGKAEEEGHCFSVRVTDPSGGSAIPGLKLWASVSGQPARLSFSITDSEGIAHFILPVLWGECNFVITAAEQSSRVFNYSIQNESIPVEQIDFPCLALREELREDIESRLFNTRMMKRFYGNQLTEYSRQEEDTTDFYGLPDKRYQLDDYTRFPNMEEILGEFIPEVRVRNPGTEDVKLQVLNLPYKKYFGSQGLVLLDGVPVVNTKSLLAMDPLLLKSIDVVPREYYIGRQTIGGIVQYKSYKKDLAGYSLGAQYFIQPFMGVQPHVQPKFFGKQRSAPTRPDLRNLLWRNPQILLKGVQKEEFNFNTGDAKGTYEIVVLPFAPVDALQSSIRSTFTVK
jgi:hypothetical protein